MTDEQKVLTYLRSQSRARQYSTIMANTGLSRERVHIAVWTLLDSRRLVNNGHGTFRVAS